MGYPPSNGWVELCEGEEVDGGRGERGVAGPTLMLYTRNFFLYSFCAQSPCIAALLFFTNICLCQLCVCFGTKIECSLIVSSGAGQNMWRGEDEDKKTQ